MSVRRNGGQNGGHYYSNITQPAKLDWNFIVDSANGNGLGVRSIKSNGYVENVFMHTSSTPGVGGNGLTNPNPLVGFALIQFKSTYNVYLGGFSGFVSTVQTSTKIDNSALTVGQAYVITTLGDATLANWQSIGVNKGITPAVGTSFIATAVGVPGEANTSLSRVMLPKPSGILCVEAIGDPSANKTSNIAVNSGQYLLVQFLAPTLSTNAYGQPMIPTAPVDGCTIGMSAFFDLSSVTIDGL